MNREIKFRGKQYPIGEWIYGSLLRVDDNDYIVQNDDVEVDGHHLTFTTDVPMFVDKDTIGQFTGIYDSHHREVYEGDMIKREDVFGGTYIVEIRSIHDGVKFVFLHDERFYLLPSDFVDGNFVFSVIGNIYDNPELIKEK